MTETLDRGWVEDAKCRGEDVNLFHPVKGRNTYGDRNMKETQDRAVAICEQCSTRQPCLEYAVHNNEKIGVWGGLTSRQRRILRSKYIRGEWP